jgi:uncharacterized protein GlcG (DUF336 family)/rhodanese-related sulfurtransferase
MKTSIVLRTVSVLLLGLNASLAPTQSHSASAEHDNWKTPVLTRAQFDKLLAKPEKLLIIDVRRPDELTSIGGLPVYFSVQAADVEKSLAWISKDRTIVTVSNHAGRAGQAADLLAAHGFKVVGRVGVQNYEEEGGKLTRIAAPPPAPAPGPGLEVASQAARAALDACAAKGFNVGVSVVDSGGALKVLLAKDGTSPRGVQSSTNKAITALALKDATSHLGERAKSEPTLASTVAANPNFNVRAGGVLLKVNDEVIGAIGVGGARGSENDEACALAGISAIQAQLVGTSGSGSAGR